MVTKSVACTVVTKVDDAPNKSIKHRATVGCAGRQNSTKVHKVHQYRLRVVLVRG